MWNDIKQTLIDTSGLGPDMLHVLFALAIYGLALLILRRPGLAFLAVALIQLGNEGLDAIGDIASGEGFKAGEAVIDTAFTLAAAGAAWLIATLAHRVRRS